MNSYEKIDTRAYIAYLAVCIVWGSTYLAIRIGVSDLPPALFAGIRFTLAGSLMLAYVYLKKLKLPKSPREIMVCAIVGLFLLFGGNGLVVWSEQMISSSLTALIVSTVPLFVAIIDFLLPGGTRIGWRGWAGLLLGFSGVAFLVSPESGPGAVDLRGVAGVLGAALFWAIGSVYSSRNPVSGAMLAISALQTLSAGIALSLTGLIAGEAAYFHLTLKGAGALLYLIFFGSIIGFSCFVYIIKAMPPAKAATYTYVNPVVAIFLGWLILHESVTLREIAATAIILAGVMIVQGAKVTGPDPKTPEAEPGTPKPAGQGLRS